MQQITKAVNFKHYARIEMKLHLGMNTDLTEIVIKQYFKRLGEQGQGEHGNDLNVPL